jgi:hypothetical protein
MLAQSNFATIVNQPTGIAQPVAHSPRELRFGQAKATLSEADAHRPAISQGSQVNFSNAVTYGSGGNLAELVAVADVNGDGSPDLVVANYCVSGDIHCEPKNCGSSCNPYTVGTIGVLLGYGNGTFQTAVTYDTGGYDAYSLAVVDVDGDGKPDIVVANQCASIAPNLLCSGDGSVGVLLGNGDGTFQTAVTYDSGGDFAFSVVVADVNGDGKPDIVVANQGCAENAGCQNGVVGVLLGNGDGTFQTAVLYSPGGYQPYSVAVADVNGDGKPDLLVANQCVSISNCNNGLVGMLLGNGDGTFQTAVTYDSGGEYSTSVAVADVNGDGKPDIVVTNRCASTVNNECSANGSVGVLLGTGGGNFQTAVTYNSGGAAAVSVAVDDVDGDGKPDIVLLNQCASIVNNQCSANGSVGVLLGNGDGTFQTAVTYDSGGVEPSSVTVSDVNGDGNADLLVANQCADSNCDNSGTVGVLINQIVPNFTLTANPATITISSPGKPGSTTIVITTYGNLNAGGLNNWSCSGLPSESYCNFGTVGTNDQISLNITTTAASDLRWPFLGHDQPLFYALLLPGFLGGVLLARRRHTSGGLRLLALVMLLGLPVLWVACGGGSSSSPPSNPGTPVGTSTVTVSASNGQLQQSTTITLTVQ